MKQRIKNNLNGVTVGNYTGGNSVVNHFYGSSAEVNQADQKKNKTDRF